MPDTESSSTVIPALHFGSDGLVPVVVQDATTDAVLMLAFMNGEALEATVATGDTHFWSRSRQMLWRKGETSGHRQIVRAIHINCEENSLLVTVDQIGTVCHTGYTSCYYRRLEADGSLITDGERAFSPETVYGATDARQEHPHLPVTTLDRELSHEVRRVFDAFVYLAEHDFTAVSGTSRLLRADANGVNERVADELRELAGVLDGSHQHSERDADVVLEGSQTLYWVIVAALRQGVTWEQLRPDQALATQTEIAAPTVTRLLRAEADRWADTANRASDWSARCHATIALVTQACHVAAVPVGALIAHERQALNAKPYLAPFFAAHQRETDRSG